VENQQRVLPESIAFRPNIVKRSVGREKFARAIFGAS